jgi:pimeloyl-ACP methyl ester carboxylesterase
MSASQTSFTKPARTIVLIHGLWMTALCWENWIRHYNVQGCRVIASSWPGMDVDMAELRRDPSSIAFLGVSDIVTHYEDIIKELEEPPIIIGHSFGALIAQILLDRGYGAAGVAIATAPAKGIFLLPFSTLRACFPALRNPSNNHRAVPLTPRQFHYAFTNTLTATESRFVYERYAVPGPAHVLFEAAFANFQPHAATRINFQNPNRPPLLLVAGEKDHISPPSLVRATHRLYRKSVAVTEMQEFSARSHFILGHEGWQQVADYVLHWALRSLKSQRHAA